MPTPRLVSMGSKRFVVGQAERAKVMRECNLLLRGIRPPQRCTCAQDHGWH